MSHHHHKHHHSGASHEHTHSSGHTHSEQHGTGEGVHHAHHDGAAAKNKLHKEFMDGSRTHGAIHRTADHETEQRGTGSDKSQHKDLAVPPVDYGKKSIDKSKSVSDLVGAGAFKTAHDAKQDTGKEGDAAVRDRTKNPVRNVEVVYQDQSSDKTRPKQEPDFRVKRDGTVEVLRNPDKGTSDKIVVEVERNANDRSAPPAAQQKSVDELVSYLSGRYMNEVTKPDGTTIKDGQIQDSQGLVSDKVKQSLHTKPTAEDSLPAEAREQTHRINRWNGSGGGSHGGDGGKFSAREGRDQFAGRDVPRQPGEDDKLAAIKDVASGFFSRGEKEPYHTVRNRGERGHAVGRYGLDHKQFMSWLMGLSEEELEKLIKEGKLPKGAADLKHGKNTPEAGKYKQFLDKMKDGKEQPTAQEIDHFLPKQLQERIGSDLVKEYAFATADKTADGKPGHVNIGKVALSMQLGHAVTDEEAQRPENQQLIKAAEQAYPLALRRAMEGDIDVDMSDAAKKIAAAAHGNLGQQLWRNHASATQFGNLGCAASVSSVLRDAGVARVDEIGVSALAANLKGHGWQAVPFSQRHPGDVIIALGPRHGHTGVVGAHRDITYDNHSGNGRWSQDRASYWTSGKWPTVYVLRAPNA